MENYHRAVIPYHRLSPEACSALAVAIDDAIKLFDRWGIPILGASRLPLAARHLRQVAESGTYGATPPELEITAKAIMLAIDFYCIASSLEQDREDVIANELAVALKGDLERRSRDRSAYEMQSQFWVGALLAQSGLHPAMPVILNRRRPDFVIRVDTLDCGVEVKRPQTENSSERALHDAAAQLREYGKPGIVVIDLSECLGTDSMIINEREPTTREVINQQTSLLADRLTNIAHTYERSNKFDRIIALFIYTRFIASRSDKDAELDIGISFRVTLFPRACGGLVIPQQRQIEQRLIRGLERLGNRVQYEYR